MMLILTETRREGHFATGVILFTSETNNVNARFTSDYSVRRSGFTLDVQSVACGEYGFVLQVMILTSGEYLIRVGLDTKLKNGNANYKFCLLFEKKYVNK